MRESARLVAVKARLRSKAGEYDEAIELLQTGYAMARHLGSEPSLVSSLAGLSIATMMDSALLDFMQRPNAPSLYWAISFRPRPLIDSRPAIETEMYALYGTFPETFDVDDKEYSTDQWDVRFGHWIAKWQEMRTWQIPPELSLVDKIREQSDVRSRVKAMKPAMSTLLVRSGMPERRVARMGDSELAMRYTKLKFEELRDELVRWMVLPYAEAAAGIRQAEDRFQKATEDGEELTPFASLLLPGIGTARHAYAKAERKHDALRIIEALRLYAGSHDGALPKSLSDVTEVPLPQTDVLTGKPFDYALDGETARLVLPEESRNTPRKLIFEITVAK